MTATEDRINELTAERLVLYRQATNGHRGDRAVLGRIAELTAQIELLWEQRRRERAGHLEGIDLVVDAVYRKTYGADYEESVSPLPVAEPTSEPLAQAA